MGTAAYLRVSTSDQTVEHQRLQVTSAGIAPDRWFTDTASGRNGADRPGFRDACNWLREGDTLVVVGVDRLGRSVREVAATLHELAEKGVALRSLREGVDTSTPTGRAIVSIMASIAELELELGKERRAASRTARIAAGLPATCPPKLPPDQARRLVRPPRVGPRWARIVSVFIHISTSVGFL